MVALAIVVATSALQIHRGLQKQSAVLWSQTSSGAGLVLFCFGYVFPCSNSLFPTLSSYEARIPREELPRSGSGFTHPAIAVVRYLGVAENWLSSAYAF
jgi:hypothetical protein